MEAKKQFQVIVVGGGTSGVVAAIAAARAGAKTALIEMKGYVGGTVVEGGTALHSFFNSYGRFQVPKVQVVRGIPEEMIAKLTKRGACSGHVEVVAGEECDSICTAIDTEKYKLVMGEMLLEEGVFLYLQSMVTGVVMDGKSIKEIQVASHKGLLTFEAEVVIDCSGYGDVSAFAGAEYVDCKDYAVTNSMGVSGFDLQGYHDFLERYDALTEYAEQFGEDGKKKIIRINGDWKKFPLKMQKEWKESGASLTVTSLIEGNLSFLKVDYKEKFDLMDLERSSLATVQLRQLQEKSIAFFRKYVDGCEKACMTRSSPCLNIRRARIIYCDKDLTNEEITSATHFEDDIAFYGYHDEFWHYAIQNGGTYGVPYRALLPLGVDNLYATGMMITSDIHAHMSTRNTVCCMAQGQAAGVAAALCAKFGCKTRELEYGVLKEALLKQDVYLG